MKKKLLFFGHSGNLGSNFIYFLKNDFNFILNINEKKLYFPDVEYIYLSEKDFLKNPDHIKDKIKSISPDLILNSAACTDLDFCQKSPKKTAFVNYILPSILSKICLELKRLDISLIKFPMPVGFLPKKDVLKKTFSFFM